MQALTTKSAALGALNAAVTLDNRNNDTVISEITAGLVGTIAFEASMDGTNWYSIAAVPLASTTTTSAVVSVVAPVATLYALEPARINGVTWVRVRVSAYTSGTCTGKLYNGLIGPGSR